MTRMNLNMKLRLLFLLTVLFLACSCSDSTVSEVPYYDTPDFTPVWKNTQEADELHKVSDFKFTDQDGNEVTGEMMKGKIYAVNFFFTSCPGICPSMTRNLLRFQKTFSSESDIKIISHSVMPEADTREKLKEYERNFGIINGKWYLVRGSISEVYSIARRSYFAEEKAGYNSDSTEFLHSENVILIDRQGHIRGIYKGTLALDIERMIEDVNLIKKEN